MILDNAGLVALPQATINKEMVKPIDGKPEIAPGKVWYIQYVKMVPVGRRPSFLDKVNTRRNATNLALIIQVRQFHRFAGEIISDNVKLPKRLFFVFLWQPMYF